MSRTYRFKKDEKWMFQYNHVLKECVNIANYYYDFRPIDPRSVEGIRRVALARSDKKEHIWISTGPGWFHNLFVQRPYRRRARKEIHKWIKNPDYEPMIEDCPHRSYWD